MKLYHGSFCEITAIDLDKCLYHTDFGHGFYLTPFKDHALNRAIQKAAEVGTLPIVNEYEFNLSNLKSGKLKVKLFSDNSDDWAEFILKNREDRSFTHDYDIVVGPIADDTMRKQFFRYKAGMISLQELSSSLEYKEDSIQYCFCTAKSLKYLKRI